MHWFLAAAAELNDRLWHTGVLIAIGAGIEWAWPRGAWIVGSRALNIGCAIAYWTFYALVGAGAAAACAHIAGRLPGSGIFALSARSVWGGLGMCAIYLFAHDFFYYWLHRAQHASRWLWPMHELHHDDPHVDFTTGWRDHWLDQLMFAVFIYLPLAYLFRMSAGVAALVAIASQVMTGLIHVNTRVYLGWQWLLTSPDFHRIHHSAEIEQVDRNFAVIFPVFDKLFGTYLAPERGRSPKTGLVSGRVTPNLLEASVAPFRAWLRLWRARS